MPIRCFHRYALLAGLSLLLSLGFLRFASPSDVQLSAWPLLAYRTIIGELDGRPCPSWPHCSAYAAQAIHRHGLLTGSLFILDRLIHEHDDRNRAPIIVDNTILIADPLWYNEQALDTHSASTM